MKMNEYNSLDQCKYFVLYHLFWCPKFRYDVLKNNVEEALQKICAEICIRYEYEILELGVMPDHVHIFISRSPRIFWGLPQGVLMKGFLAFPANSIMIFFSRSLFILF